MKTDGFVKLLRKVIREEVRNAIKAELKPILREVQISKNDINLQEIAKPVVKKNPASKKRFTKNDILNDMLNETASTPALMNGDAEWPSMDFKADMAESFGMGQQPLAVKGINGEAVDMSNEKVASAVGAMTKDYSALMKAIDKKKGIR